MIGGSIWCVLVHMEGVGLYVRCRSVCKEQDYMAGVGPYLYIYTIHIGVGLYVW